MTPATPAVVVDCEACDGTGTVPERVDPAVWADDVECDRCEGSGLVTVEACDVCALKPALSDSDLCGDCLQQREASDRAIENLERSAVEMLAALRRMGE